MTLSEMIQSNKSAAGFTVAALVLSVASVSSFLSMREAEPIIPGPGVTKQHMLSEYNPNLAGSTGDTPVFELAGEKPGGTVTI